MPTAYEFDVSAAALERSAEATESILGTLRSELGPEVLTGGLLTRLTESTLEVSERTATTTAASLRDDAQLCRNRAETCRQYGDSLQRYDNAMSRWHQNTFDLPDGIAKPPRPTRPSRPASWVEL